MLPTAFLSKRDQQSTKKEKVYTYDRDIICLPKGLVNKRGIIAIPKGSAARDNLAKKGLIGKIRLVSSMKEGEIFNEIRSVFRGPMDHNETFLFDILQVTGTSLMIPAVSSSYKWTASAVAGKNAKVPIYIIAGEELKVTTTRVSN